MEDLTDSEIEGIWVRIKQHIQTDQIKGATPEMQKSELKRIMTRTTTKNDTATASLNVLESYGFSDRAVKSKTIRSDLLASQIKTTEIKGVTRFSIAKGTPTFIDLSGRKVKAGQFLAGKSESEAKASLERKSSS